MKAGLAILHLEDDARDAALVEDTLAADGIICRITRVETRADFIASLERGGYDLIVADYTLPSFDGLSALKIARERWAHLPFIFVSGTLDEEVAIEALKIGATDYVFKTRLSRIVPSVRRAFREAEERAELGRAEAALRRSEQYLAEAQRLSHTGSFGWNVANGKIYWSRETFRIFGYEPASTITIDEVVKRTHPDDQPFMRQVIDRVSHERAEFDFEHRLLMPDGSIKYIHVVGHPAVDEAGHFEFVGAVTDVTERRAALEEISQRTHELAAANDELKKEVAERRRAEDALRETERASRLIVETIPGLVAIMTPAGEVGFVNHQLGEYCGQSLEEMRQWGTNGTVHPADLPRVIQVFTAAITSGDPYDFEARIRRFDRVYRWFQIRGLPLRDISGHIVRWYVLLADVDERKRAEEALAASERNLKLIIDTIPALAWSARPDGSAEFFSQHYLDFVGLSAEQSRGWGWAVAVHPEDLSALAATWQRIMASEAPGEAEARLRRHDGEYRWFLFRASPLRDESGTIVEWYGVNTDIEDRKRAEAELKRAYDSFADAQRLSKTGSFITDLVGDDHNWSEEAYRIFEFDPATKVTVERIREFIHPDDLPSFDAVIARGLTGMNVSFGFRIVTARGAVKHVRGVAHVTDQIDGRPMFIGALQDVTESMVAEEALNRARAELTHVARVTSLSTLTASIAHEVNQPLSGIITNASTCLRMLDVIPPDIEGARETARRTIRDGNRASDVITRLRALFSKKEFTLEPLDLNEATREVVALSLSELQRNRVVLQSELADDLPRIIGDRVQLQQVLLNLLRNAWEAMNGVDDRPRHLLIRTEREAGDHVRAMVRDAGVGIDRQAMDKLFDAFYTTKSGGMGIGLSVSRSIVERHHGRLWADANDGPGATFSFSIPAAQQASRMPVTGNTKV
jgi:PAS domain S-box-containing protein